MDTSAVNEKLRAADFTPQQAKAIMAAIAESVNSKEYLTKADMAELKADMSKLSTTTESEMIKLEAKFEIHDSKLETRVLNRMLFVLVVVTIALLACFNL